MCLFLFCSAPYFANLSSVKSVLCLAGTTFRVISGTKDAMEGVELLSLTVRTLLRAILCESSIKDWN